MKTTAFRFAVLLAAVVLLVLWAAPTQGEGATHKAPGAGNPLRPSSGETCERPLALSGPLPYSHSGTTAGTGDDYDLTQAGTCAGGGFQLGLTGLGEDDVLVMATDLDCLIAVSMTPQAGVDLALYVVSPDCSDVAANCVFVDDEGGEGAVEVIEFPAASGQYYFIIVDGYDNDSGSYELVVDSAGSCKLAYLYASIGDRVWADANGNGIQDSDEVDLTVGQVDLYQCGGAQIDFMPLAPSGGYLFGDVMPGQYFLEFSAPLPGYGFSPQDQGTDDARDSDPNPSTSRTACFQAVAGVLDRDWDAGVMSLTSGEVGDRVWYDIDQDGIQDGGEPGLRDLTVKLYANATCQGSPSGTDTTDASGYYGFSGLTPGTYCLDFGDGVPYGWAFSPADQGADDTVDSDADLSTRRVENINVQGTDRTVDAGMFMYGVTRGRVFCDQDGNRSFDPGEGVGAVTLQLHADADCNTQPEGLLSSQDTDAGGAYLFHSLKTGPPGGPPVCYVVKVDVGDMGACSDPLGAVEEAVALHASDPDRYVDFGFRQATGLSLGDYVWYDTDHDGLQDASEPGVQGVGVELYANATCQGSRAAADTTDGAGLYGFGGLSPGTYCLSFADGIPAGWSVTGKDKGSDDGLDSDVDRATRLIENISLSAGDLTRDAGLFAEGRIEGRVFCDRDASGGYDFGEGVDGVTVTLYDDDNCDTAGDGVLGTKDTVSGGWYGFNPVRTGPPGGPPVCFVIKVDAGDMGACDVPLSSDERYVGLTTDDSESLDNFVGFVELPHPGTRMYLPLVPRLQTAR